MKFSIEREALVKPLSLVSGVVERRQTLPILANVLLSVEEGVLSLVGTDLEVELSGRVALEDSGAIAGAVTVPGRKLFDICKSLPEGSVIDMQQDGANLIVRSGRSRFRLATLPAAEFPIVDALNVRGSMTVDQLVLKGLIEQTGFAMAQQDVRYYLNGMLWELSQQAFRVVATDGHRLATSHVDLESGVVNGLSESEATQIILPRKGVLELSRLLQASDVPAEVSLGDNHLKVDTAAFTFISKLVDGKFPDYQRVLPKNSTKAIIAEKDALKSALSRAAILSNEKYRGIKLNLSDHQLQVVANNPEQEEAEEVIQVEYQGGELEIGFNVSYLLDVLAVLTSANVKVSLSDSSGSALLEGVDTTSNAMYVVMPMRL